MRISDWSPDVCSSVLPRLFRREARMSQHPGLAAWHAYMAGGGDPRALRDLLAEDAIFHSPVVHTPPEGADKVFPYLHAASHRSDTRRVGKACVRSWCTRWWAVYSNKQTNTSRN